MHQTAMGEPSEPVRPRPATPGRALSARDLLPWFRVKLKWDCDHFTAYWTIKVQAHTPEFALKKAERIAKENSDLEPFFEGRLSASIRRLKAGA